MESQITQYNSATDYAALVALFTQERATLYQSPILEQDIKRLVTLRFTPENTFVYKKDNQCVGFINYTLQEPYVSCCGLLYRGGSCSINYIAVNETNRRQGFGKLLLDAVTNNVRYQPGLLHIDACTSGDNQPAKGLLEKAGFTAAKSRGQPHRLYTLPLTPESIKKAQ